MGCPLSWRHLSEITGLGLGIGSVEALGSTPSIGKNQNFISEAVVWVPQPCGHENTGVLRNGHCLSRRLVYGPTETTLGVLHSPLQRLPHVTHQSATECSERVCSGVESLGQVGCFSETQFHCI